MNTASPSLHKAWLIAAILAVLAIAMLLTLAWPLSRMTQNPGETVDAFVEAIRRQDAAAFTRLMESAEFRHIPEAGDRVYFNPFSGQEPNLAFLGETPFTATLVRRTEPRTGGVCFVPLACPEWAFFEYRLTFSDDPPVYFLPEWLALRNDRPMPKERYEDFLAAPGKLPNHFTYRVRSLSNLQIPSPAGPASSVSFPSGPPGSAPVVSRPMSYSLLMPSPKPGGRVEGLTEKDLAETLPRLENVLLQIQVSRHSKLDPWKIAGFDFGQATVIVNGKTTTFDILSTFSGIRFE